MAGFIRLLNGLEIQRIPYCCRACGADLADFLAYEQYHEILYCLNCHEEVPIEDVAFDAYCYQARASRQLRWNYHEHARKEWQKSRRRIPK